MLTLDEVIAQLRALTALTPHVASVLNTGCEMLTDTRAALEILRHRNVIASRSIRTPDIQSLLTSRFRLK
jgi:hypothetical protein